MSAYESRGRGVLVKLRVEQRLSLEELTLVLFASYEDVDAEPEFTVADIRQAVAAQLAREGYESTLTASDRIRGDKDDGDEDTAERLAWARRMVAKAYRRDFAKFPEVLASFERGESA
ncbi:MULTISPECIES: hypothetical protein [Streptomyces]|uniref:hypothetical protein n=1 Tax=Streptomyces TaxID=1883 RepID=UPI00299FA719|nr:hypothetical protein [Streptomyces stelliscabiei]MDX2520543.1 hypothetical protein [Streptomyces stelliscabiei]MDX2552640.1 hypothetical protein [Streptomyces stelliscabiei]MDX2661324.1 hypothetical protein [Streptomyces stelliscabiei]MDX2788805.1 hypothetical protein [Streptomyces stelliscabiei]